MNNNKIKELKIDEIVWLTFIALSVLNIIGDEYEIDYYQYNNQKKDKNAKKIFTLTVAVSTLIYIYFFKKNYERLEELKEKKEDSTLAEIRLLGSTFILAGILCLLYFQLNSQTPSNPSIV